MKFDEISNEAWVKETDNLVPYDAIQIPTRGTKHSAGYDFYSTVETWLRPGEEVLIPTGIKFDCDTDKFLMIVPRSGLGFKYGTMLANSVGVIDADYYNNSNNEGHIWVKLTIPNNKWSQEVHIHVGDRICQGIIVPYYTVENDDAKTTRNGGLGSTDK